MSADDALSRIAVAETRLNQHHELLQRAVVALEQQATFNGLLASHMEEGKRVWNTLESHGQQLLALRASDAATCAFCATLRKALWVVAPILFSALGYLLLFWLKNQDHLPAL